MTVSIKKFQIICLLIQHFIISPSECQLQFFLEEVRSLSELPMSKLIKIRSNLAENNNPEIHEQKVEVEGRMSLALPMTMPLKRVNNKLIKRRGDYWEEKGQDTKISKIFQLTITTLSFLAFGGYLLTLVITAIRRNPMSNGSNVIVVNRQKYTRPKRHLFINDIMENEFDIDKMYRGMIILSEGFASYNKLR